MGYSTDFYGFIEVHPPLNEKEIEFMKDITVKEIIETFKGVEREEIRSTDKSDNFLDILQKKKHWTIEEYKEFSLAYDLEYMHSKIMDFIRISTIEKKYGFKLKWNDYFNVIDNLKNLKKQKEYINYYIWYHYNQMNEDTFKELMKKSYFHKIGFNAKVKFLKFIIKTDNSMLWVNQYFTNKELIQGLKNNNLYINVYSKNSINNRSKLKENNVKNFYKQYESILDNKSKIKLLMQSIQAGSTRLIEFFYKENKLNKINKQNVLWNVCSETSAPNTLEILNCLKTLKVNFCQNDLEKIKKKNQWEYMENKEELIHFFKTLEVEKNYNKLNKKLTQNKIKVKIKLNKI